MKEIWKDIEGYEGYYQISNLGRVKSLSRNILTKAGWNFNLKEKIKNSDIRKDGYYSIMLSKEGINKRYVIHRLLAIAFIPNPNNKPQINHIDGNKLNNSVENLEWVTNEENSNHAYQVGLIDRESLIERGKKASNIRKTSVVQYSINGEFINKFESLQEAAEAIGVYPSNISSCCSGRYKTCGGFIFKKITN